MADDSGSQTSSIVVAEDGITRAEPWEENYRLPESTVPTHYDLYLYPDLTTKLFSGRVTIEINSTEARDYFVLHSKWLEITDPVLRYQETDGSWQVVPMRDSFYYTPNEYYVVRTNTQVPAGMYQFSCSFTGSLIDNGLVGFYYSDYVDENNSTRILATTKFEPTYARQSFPCFDEPSFKSTYSVTVVRPSDPDYRVLSNMPVEKEEADLPSTDLTEVTFEKSVPMVTYLVCFIVCDFTYIEDVLPSGLDFRVYAPRARVNNTQYALDSGASILQFYETMFDLPFPLPKSDMAAIPDYVSGATEHWGIITYRETSIFYNPAESSETNKQRVCSVVAHELAHQWFGNLVTLNWWDDLWLNEGFASYIEYKGVNHVEPDWDMASQFCVHRLQPVFNIDSRVTSHPIVKTVCTPDQITGMFDRISYFKGSSVLRMLEGFVGESVFQAGINSFLKRYAYGNAVTAQLWTELTTAWNDAGVEGDVGVIMGTWTEQMGYPVLTVSRSGPLQITVTQERFLQDPTAVSDPNTSPHGYKWHIPISYITSASPTQQNMTWLYKDDESVTIALELGNTWFKLNSEQMGYFRVNYEDIIWETLKEKCADQTLGPSDRASLYDDSLALADSGRLQYSVALDLSTSLETETHLVPWAAANNRLPRIIYLLETTDSYVEFKNYVAHLTEPTYTTLGWQDEGDHIQQLLRVEVVYLSCISGLVSCLQESGSLLQQYASDADYALPLATKRQVLRQGMVTGGTDTVWQELWQRATVMQDATQKDNILYGLANSQDVDTLAQYIEMSKDSSLVRTQDFLHVLQYISTNPVGTDLVWDWTRANWDWLVDRYTLNDRYLGELIPNISQYFATQEKLDEMEAFFVLYPESGAGEQYREQALETVRTNILWVEANAPQIRAWLDARASKVSSE